MIIDALHVHVEGRVILGYYKSLYRFVKDWHRHAVRVLSTAILLLVPEQWVYPGDRLCVLTFVIHTHILQVCLIGNHKDVTVYYETVWNLVQGEFRHVLIRELIVLSTKDENLHFFVLMHCSQERLFGFLAWLAVGLEIYHVRLQDQFIN